jgi:hypothetical protein
VKVLFVIQHPGFMRNFEAAVRRLADECEQVTLAFNRWDDKSSGELALSLSDELRNVRLVPAPHGEWNWLSTARLVRGSQDYLRYFDPRYENTPKLSERAVDKTVGAKPARLLRRIPGVTARNAKRLARLQASLQALEGQIPTDPLVDAFLEGHQPDVMIITPLINFNSDQVDFVKSARKLGIPTILAVASWDNLTNKGLIRVSPDAVFVWNEAQKQEAVELHGIAEQRVVATGAHTYDGWAQRRPSTERPEFCVRVGLDPHEPFVLYTCSSPFIGSTIEVDFVRAWLADLRANGFARLGVLIRPHPQNAEVWDRIDLSEFGNVAIYPRAGADPVNAGAKADFFDSIHFSDIVVGINTSAQIEAAVVGRPVMTVEHPLFAETQSGTLHYHLLVKHGLLSVAGGFEEHRAQLRAILDAPDEARARVRAFADFFVRPRGWDTPAAELFAEEVQKLARQGSSLGPLPAHRGLRGSADRAVLHALRAKLEPKRRPRPRLPALDDPENFRAPQSFRMFRRAVGEFDAVFEELHERFASSGNFLVGPWTAEVGFELLYWIPMLRRMLSLYGIAPNRVTAMSRGGTKDWYRDIGLDYLDAFDVLDVSEFRRRLMVRHQGGGQKQLANDELDEHLLARARERLGDDLTVIPPNLMYRLLRQYWLGRVPRKRFESIMEYRRFAPPELGELREHLPERYTAVRFYTRPSLPDTPENRAAIQASLAGLLEQGPVVLLGSDFRVDDHADHLVEQPGLIRLNHLMTPANNLDIQTRVIAHAESFVSTYGGLAYLGSLLGTPTIAATSHPEHLVPSHIELAVHVFHQLQVDFLHVNMAQMPRLDLIAAARRAGDPTPPAGGTLAPSPAARA